MAASRRPRGSDGVYVRCRRSPRHDQRPERPRPRHEHLRTRRSGGRAVRRAGNRATFAWDPATGASTYTDAEGGAWLDVYASKKLLRHVDPMGNTTSSGATFTYDAAGNGALLRRYTYGLDLLAQTTSNKGPYWYHHDGLGSVTDITSATGSPLAWTEYTPFGAIRAAGATSQAPANPFRFTGEYQVGVGAQ